MAKDKVTYDTNTPEGLLAFNLIELSRTAKATAENTADRSKANRNCHFAFCDLAVAGKITGADFYSQMVEAKTGKKPADGDNTTKNVSYLDTVASAARIDIVRLKAIWKP